MSLKRILACALALVMVLSTMTVSVFAEDPKRPVITGTKSLNASKPTVAAGDTFTITMPIESEKAIGALSVKDFDFNEDAFTLVSITSDFFEITGGADMTPPFKFNGDVTTPTKKNGNLFTAEFKVNPKAQGREYTFTADYAEIAHVDGAVFYDFTPAKVTVSAPAKLVMSDVTLDANTKTATWSPVDDANEYTVTVSDGTNVLHTEVITATEFKIEQYVTKTATYEVTVFANQVDSLHLASDPKTATAEIIVNSTVVPASKDYVTGSNGFDVTMTLNGNALIEINDGAKELVENTDYTKSGNVVSIEDKYLKNLTTETTLTFKFNKGNVATVKVKVAAASDFARLILAEKKLDDYSTDDEAVVNDGTSDGLIVVSSEVSPVTNFLAAQFSINNTAAQGKDIVEYKIVPEEGYALSYDKISDMYIINAKPVNGVVPAISEDAATKGIVIGRIVREGKGYGEGEIKADNITITVETSDNGYRELEASDFSFKYKIPEPLRNLAIDVDFSILPTRTANDKNYQKMAISLYSTRLGEINIDLGANEGTTPVYKVGDGLEDVKAFVTSAENKYTVTIKNLPAFQQYTVNISGDGYRSANSQFNLNEDTTVYFWSNANDSEKIHIAKENAGTEAMLRKNFLAGDILMNGVIDLYDLSAVSSYYGKSVTVADSEYIQYDLTRDQKVDIFDVTTLLAGWSE